MSGGGRLTSRLGVRASSTLVAVVVVGIALLLSGLVVVVVLRSTLYGSVEQSVAQRAADVAAQISADEVQSAAPTIAAASIDGTLIQVIAPDGTVLLASPALAGRPPLTAARPKPGEQIRAESHLPLTPGDDPYWVASSGVRSSTGDYVVIAAKSLAGAESTYHTVALLLLAVAPLLMAAAGAATWVAVGRSLTTVERIRHRVDTIGAADLHQRVPVPPSGDEVAALATTMNQMLDRLERSAVTQRQFVADASHELRSPLASLRASIDVASSSPDSGAWEEASPVLSDEVDRMSSLVGDLLLLAKADEGVGIFRQVDVDLDDIVLAEVSRLRTQSDLTVTADVVPARASGDPDALARAVRNLTDNAARFAVSTVALRVGIANGQNFIVVEDDGPGIAPADRERATERFVRLEDHRSRTGGGSGLGLAIVAEIVRAHSGKLVIDSSLLGGTRVTLTLPG